MKGSVGHVHSRIHTRYLMSVKLEKYVPVILKCATILFKWAWGGGGWPQGLRQPSMGVSGPASQGQMDQ